MTLHKRERNPNRPETETVVQRELRLIRQEMQDVAIMLRVLVRLAREKGHPIPDPHGPETVDEFIDRIASSTAGASE
jgi:hypothetical protein